jgi:hypothetical protein
VALHRVRVNFVVCGDGHSGHSGVNMKLPRPNSRTMNKRNLVEEERGLEIYRANL